MPEFDPRASIKRLAEWERPRKSLPDFVGDAPGSIGTQNMEAPFAALRVQCPCLVAPPGESYMAYEEHPIACKRCWTKGKHSDKDCYCQGLSWVPEHDPRVACNEVARIVQELDSGQDIVAWWYHPDERRWYWNNPAGKNILAESYGEAVLRAAEALMEEKR